MYRRPCEEEAVKVRAPIMDAPRAAAMALCSLSTIMYRASDCPSAMKSASFSTSVVWGVIG